jgi:anti-sigma regulatory factor (Ser/Thr protein kinase)
VKVTVQLDPDSHAPMDARTVLERIEGELSRQVYDDLRLVVSELVTNAVLHGPGTARVGVTLEVRDGLVRGEVTDEGRGTVEIREAAGEGGGFGLQLLDRISERWGVHPGSTHVWFELREDPPTDR